MLLRYPPVVILLAVPGLLMALVFHEWAHARMAVAFGDQTPRLQGRLSLDPRAHLDWLGLIALLVAGFGWARPVQVNFHRLRPRFWGELLVALAGILMNIGLAAVFTLLAALADGGYLFGLHNRFLTLALELGASINLALAAFNFLPVPPLDGWRVAVRLIPGFSGTALARFLDQFGMFFLMVLVFLWPGGLGLLIGPIRLAMAFLVDLLTGPVLRLL